jgi:hypothetical protein
MTWGRFRGISSLWVGVWVIWLVVTGGCERAHTTQPHDVKDAAAARTASMQTEASESAEESPLLLEDEPLLLLNETSDNTASDGPAADNNRCFVCHLNYAQEDIAATHARANIGCVDCHGASDAHIADESWASGGNGTAPDIMYPRDKINAACMACHPKDELDAPQHEPVFADAPERKGCTDCHGDHRLPQRRCKWK